MSNMPERIWAVASLGLVGSGRWVTQGIENPHGNVEYARTDLPPTLSAALAVPQVAAIVEALAAFKSSYEENSDGVIRAYYMAEKALSALDAAKGE